MYFGLIKRFGDMSVTVNSVQYLYQRKKIDARKWVETALSSVQAPKLNTLKTDSFWLLYISTRNAPVLLFFFCVGFELQKKGKYYK